MSYHEGPRAGKGLLPAQVASAWGRGARTTAVGAVHRRLGVVLGRLVAAEKIRLAVEAEDAGLRLDQFLAAKIPELSRRRARVVLDIGGVFVDRARVKVAGRKVRPGQVVDVVLGGALERSIKKTGTRARDAERARLPAFDVVFRDGNLLVAHKPAGLLSAPTPESDRNNLLDLLRRSEEGPVWLVHRIDLETSGLLVFARSEMANKSLGEAFRTHSVQREYFAVVEGRWPPDLESIDDAIDGRAAKSRFSVVASLARASATLLRVVLETGRTHQIRLHCSRAGHPVLGDRRYGQPSALAPPRMALHARVLGFEHPASGEALRFERDMPEDLAGWLEALE